MSKQIRVAVILASKTSKQMKGQDQRMQIVETVAANSEKLQVTN
jgi:hypothetical protein